MCEKSPRILAIAAGKGGVGKSTVAVYLARALQERGERVGILDADLYGPSVPRMVPAQVPTQRVGQRILPAEAQGLKVLSLAHFRPDEKAAAMRAPIANGIIGQFVRQVDWGSLDTLIIDFPPGTGDIQLTLCQQLQITGAILVTTPQEVALLDVRKGLALFRQLEVPVLGIVENMSCIETPTGPLYPFGRGGGARLAQEAGLPLLAELPLDPKISQHCDEGRVEAREEFMALAGRLSAPVPSTISWSQPDPQTLLVAGVTHRPHDLQKRCPCASCKGAGAADPEVKFTAVKAVGGYAIQFRFSSGCSSGIYRLKELSDA